MTRSTGRARTASVHNRSSTSSATTSAFVTCPGYDPEASFHPVREPRVGDDDEGDDEDPDEAERERPELEVGQQPRHHEFSESGGERKGDLEPAVLPEYSVQQQADA